MDETNEELSNEILIRVGDGEEFTITKPSTPVMEEMLMAQLRGMKYIRLKGHKYEAIGVLFKRVL